MKFHAMLVSATEDRRRSPSNSDRLIPKGTYVPIHCRDGWLGLKTGMRKVVAVINKTAYGDRTHIFILHIATSHSPNIAAKWKELLLPLRELSELIIGPESGSPNKAVKASLSPSRQIPKQHLKLSHGRFFSGPSL